MGFKKSHRMKEKMQMKHKLHYRGYSEKKSRKSSANGVNERVHNTAALMCNNKSHSFIHKWTIKY